MDTFAHIHGAAHESAAGINGFAPPTAEQARAGNYKKGRCSLHGFNIAIETPAGQRRTGKSDGQPWSVICMAHYGYIEGVKGADGDELDAYVGPYPESPMVYVVNRENADGGFDEHKCLFGFPSQDAAVRAYTNSYERGQDGLGSVVPLSINQFRWWVANGDLAVPLTPDTLPYDGIATMNNVIWDSTSHPVGITTSALLYAMRREDTDDLLLDAAVTVQDILEDSEGELALDALVIPLNQLERKMNQMMLVMRAAGTSVKPMAMQVTPPFKLKGTTQVAVIYELSDGQTISVFFHNPDMTPNTLTPGDEMVSWKWLLNKKDVTIVVAPERGRDLSPREVGRRVMRLAEANSSRFQKQNETRAARMGAIASLRTSVEEKTAELAGLDAEILVLEERVEAQRNKVPATLEGQDTGIGATVEPQPATIQTTDHQASDHEPQNSGDGTQEDARRVDVDQLPPDWSEASPGGMATSEHPTHGGIVDKAIVDGLWFVVPKDLRIPQRDDFPDRQAAFAYLAEQIELVKNLPQPTETGIQEDPVPTAEDVSPEPDNLAIAKAFLRNIIAGTEDLGAADLADRLMVLNTFGGETEFDGLYAQAIDVYQAAVIALARKALAA